VSKTNSGGWIGANDHMDKHLDTY